LPVALGVLWLHCAQAAGWGAHGINFPGHFLLAMEGDKAKAVLDVFVGGTPLDARELRALLKRFQGEKAELTPNLLRPMGNRDVLLRLQENVKGRRLQAGDFAAALAAVEDSLRIAPAAAMQWRDAALINQHLDRVAAALRCYERFLELVPSGESAARIRSAMDELRTRLN
jgi:regulator of sirC expression with transglutaminase-like and TPR domain